MRVCTVCMAAALPGVHVGPSWAGGQRACSAVSSGKPAGEVKPTRRRCRRRRRVMLASARAAPSSRLVWPTSSSQTCVPERLTALPQHLGPAFQLPVEPTTGSPGHRASRTVLGLRLGVSATQMAQHCLAQQALSVLGGCTWPSHSEYICVTSTVTHTLGYQCSACTLSSKAAHTHRWKEVAHASKVRRDWRQVPHACAHRVAPGHAHTVHRPCISGSHQPHHLHQQFARNAGPAVHLRGGCMSRRQTHFVPDQ